MKIEIGKSYRTKQGKKVRIYATDGGGYYPIHGAELMDEGWHHNIWPDDGIYSHNDGADVSHSLVSLWEEPKRICVDMSDLEKQVKSQQRIIDDLVQFEDAYQAQLRINYDQKLHYQEELEKLCPKEKK